MRDIAGAEEYKKEALRYLGYRGQEMEPELYGELNAAFSEAESLISPRGTAGVYPVLMKEEGIALEGTALLLPGRDIREHLAGAEKVLLMAVTLGAEPERRLLLREKRKEMSRAVVLDAAFSALAEAAADEYEKKLVEKAEKEGYVTNWRFSPGYGDFPLELQKGIAEVLRLSRTIGVTVTEESLLIPRKTITAVIGLFSPAGKRAGKKLGCGICPLKGDCEFRRWGRSCWQERE